VRKTVPFLLTVVLTVICTAGIVRASSSSSDQVLGASVTPSRVLGIDLSLARCNPGPRNAAEWSNFAKCVTTSFTRIRKWANTLDTCLRVQPVQSRSNAIYGDDPGDITHTDWTNGEALSYGTGGGFKYLVEWRQVAGCPTT
jgi:hypothetical protein